MKDVADLFVALPVEVEYEVSEETITINRVFIVINGQKLDVTSKITEDDWVDILWSIETDYLR